MVRQQEQQFSDPVVDAIERVLKTERDGVEVLRQSQGEASRLLTQARAQATAIAGRADSCISKLHAAYLQKIDQDMRKIAASNLAPGASADKAYDAGALANAARRVATKLTGES